MFEDIYQHSYSLGRISAELEVGARALILMYKHYTEKEPDKLEKFLSELPEQSMGFLQEALEIIKKYPGYSVNHQCYKAIHEATWLPYNFYDYEEEKAKIRKASKLQGQEEPDGTTGHSV